MMSLPYRAAEGQVLHTPHLIGSNLGPTRVIGSGAIKSENFSSGSAGWSIDGDGNVEFNSGTFRGAIGASTIDIGGSDATSFHVDIDGNLWAGANTYASAPFRVSNTGQLDIGGDDATSWHIDNTGFMWSGASTANKATAPFRVTTDGVVYANDIRISGGTIGGTGINGNVTLSTSGVFRTAASGKRIEMTNTAGDTITFYTGNVNEFTPGKLSVTSSWVELRAPYLTSGPSAVGTVVLSGEGVQLTNELSVNNASAEFGDRLALSTTYPNVIGETYGSSIVFTSSWASGGGTKQWAVVGGYKGANTSTDESFLILDNPNLGVSDITSGATKYLQFRNGWAGFLGRDPSTTYKFDIGVDTMRLASGTGHYTLLQFGNSATASVNTHLVNTTYGSNVGCLEVYSGNSGSGTKRLAIYTNLPHAFAFGAWSGGSSYSAFTTTTAAVSGYLILTDNGTTYISTVNTGYNVYIRPSANDATYQIIVSTTSVAATLTGTASANTVRDAGFGALGYFTSRAETKENIKTVKGKDALDRVLALRPVEFNFKKDYIGNGTNDLVVLDRKRGFVAEEVEAVDRVATIYGWLEPGDSKKLAGPREDELPVEDAVAIQWSPEAMVADLVAVVQDLHERIITLEAKK